MLSCLQPPSPSPNRFLSKRHHMSSSSSCPRETSRQRVAAATPPLASLDSSYVPPCPLPHPCAFVGDLDCALNICCHTGVASGPACSMHVPARAPAQAAGTGAHAQDPDADSALVSALSEDPASILTFSQLERAQQTAALAAAPADSVSGNSGAIATHLGLFGLEPQLVTGFRGARPQDRSSMLVATLPAAQARCYLGDASGGAALIVHSTANSTHQEVPESDRAINTPLSALARLAAPAPLPAIIRNVAGHISASAAALSQHENTQNSDTSRRTSSPEPLRKRLIADVTREPVELSVQRVDVDFEQNNLLKNQLLLDWISNTLAGFRRQHGKELQIRRSSLDGKLEQHGFDPLSEKEEGQLTRRMSERTSRYVRTDIVHEVYKTALGWQFNSFNDVLRGRGLR